MNTLDELMRLREAATPGPVQALAKIVQWPLAWQGVSLHRLENGVNNAAYIAAACNAIPRLVEVIRMANAGLMHAKEQLSEKYVFIGSNNPAAIALAAIRALDEQDGAL